jgi:hypothetical protein
MNKSKFEWQALWDEMDANPSQWIETTEDMYFEMLGVLPPRKMVGDSFMVGEPLRHNGKGEAIHACFTKLGDTYKARNLTLVEFMAEHGYIPARELR